MAISVVCPECKLLLTVDEAWAGHRVPCERCGTRVNIPQPFPRLQITPDDAPPARPGPSSLGLPPERPLKERSSRPEFADPGYQERHPSENDPGGPGYDRGYDPGEPEGRRPYEVDHPLVEDFFLETDLTGWTLVHTGLGLMFWGLVSLFLVILGFVGFFILTVFLIGVGDRGGGMGPFAVLDGVALGRLFPVLLGLALLIAFVLTVIGQCMCCTAPLAEARGKATASVVCLLIGTALLIGFGCLNSGWDRGPFGRRFHQFGEDPQTALLMVGMVFVGGIVFLIGHVLFISFLTAVARRFRNQSLAESTSGYLTLYFTLMGLQLAIACLQGAVRDQSAGLFLMCFSFILLIMGIILLVWYIRLLAGTRDTIAGVR